LTSNASAQFSVPGPAAAPVRYRVRLAATSQHAAAFVEVVVPAR
jgi:hypothetical protein